MKKFKLIKEYPGSPSYPGIQVMEVNDRYEYRNITGGLIYFDKEEIEIYPEYWEEIKEEIKEVKKSFTRDEVKEILYFYDRYVYKMQSNSSLYYNNIIEDYEQQ